MCTQIAHRGSFKSLAPGCGDLKPPPARNPPHGVHETPPQGGGFVPPLTSHIYMIGGLRVPLPCGWYCREGGATDEPEELERRPCKHAGLEASLLRRSIFVNFQRGKSEKLKMRVSLLKVALLRLVPPRAPLLKPLCLNG